MKKASILAYACLNVAMICAIAILASREIDRQRAAAKAERKEQESRREFFELKKLMIEHPENVDPRVLASFGIAKKK